MEQSMKIVQIIPTLGIGGAETVCESLSKALASLGHHLTIISLFTEKTIITSRMEAEGLSIIYLDKKTGIDLRCIIRLRKVIKKIKPDVIHTHLYALKYAVLASIGLNIPVIHTVHNIAQKESSRLNRKINKIFYKLNCAVPVALSDEIRTSIVSEYKLHESHVPIIFNGIDLSKCIAKKDYVLHNPARIVHVGRFFEQKNHNCMINVMSKIYSKVPVHLDFYGDGPLMDDIKEQSKILRLENVISFQGVSSNIYQHLNTADIFILPSKWEGMPISIIEAMGTGMPIIASRVGGIPDMLRHRESGILIVPEEKELENAILDLLENAELRKALGREAKKMSEKFSVVNMAKSYLLLYGERN